MNKAFGAICVQIVLACAMASPGTSGAQHLFKCGNVFQDRPCPTEEVQQRYSGTSGKFSVEQVNADTDKDCANFGQQSMPLWQRMHDGEPLEKLKAEIDARPISRYEKSQMRDVLLTLREFKGKPTEVRSELERQCMSYKRSKGIATERDVARAQQAQGDRMSQAKTRSEIREAQALEARDAAELRAQQYREQRARDMEKAAAARKAYIERQTGIPQQ
jgi:hypothetical protein